MSAVLERLWRPGGRRRNPTDLFGQADRLRREGRYAEATTLVTSGLALDPNSVTGHLLAAYLHAAQRTIEPAKREFRWVLGRDPVHPRALLGLARLALEEGDLVGCRECLSSALRAYPDFPEARAVLDALTAGSPTNRPGPRDEAMDSCWSISNTCMPFGNMNPLRYTTARSRSGTRSATAEIVSPPAE